MAGSRSLSSFSLTFSRRMDRAPAPNHSAVSLVDCIAQDATVHLLLPLGSKLARGVISSLGRQVLYSQSSRAAASKRAGCMTLLGLVDSGIPRILKAI